MLRLEYLTKASACWRQPWTKPFQARSCLDARVDKIGKRQTMIPVKVERLFQARKRQFGLQANHAAAQDAVGAAEPVHDIRVTYQPTWDCMGKQ